MVSNLITCSPTLTSVAFKEYNLLSVERFGTIGLPILDVPKNATINLWQSEVRVKLLENLPDRDREIFAEDQELLEFDRVDQTRQSLQATSSQFPDAQQPNK